MQPLIPDPFLELIRQKKRGSLKLHIGMAAGVGKTYRMLAEAQAMGNVGRIFLMV